MPSKNLILTVFVFLVAACSATTPAPTSEPEELTLESTVTPTAPVALAEVSPTTQMVETQSTFTFSCSASNAIQAIIDFTVTESWSFGDGERWTVSIISFNKDWENPTVYVVEPGFSVTVEADEMNVFSYTLDGRRENVLCFVSKIGAEQVRNKVYAGIEVPEGWIDFQNAASP